MTGWRASAFLFHLENSGFGSVATAERLHKKSKRSNHLLKKSWAELSEHQKKILEFSNAPHVAALLENEYDEWFCGRHRGGSTQPECEYIKMGWGRFRCKKSWCVLEEVFSSRNHKHLYEKVKFQQF